GCFLTDMICSTFRWLKYPNQTLEYGKKYDGYWNREPFVKQDYTCFQKGSWTIISNMRPGGKQAKMQDGWYIMHGKQITQEMCFHAGHPEFPGQPK
ncbi:hypothetical protein L208DRAFT_1040565, partial [Tricholoma matsutake]